jgi:SAM-dependent methyltransferase
VIIDTPLFVLTSDIDWASDPCIDELTGFAAGLGIRPTLFSTHKSELIDRLGAEGAAEIGVHPNFLPNSSHGSNPAAVIDEVMKLVPGARSSRSHTFMDSTLISTTLRSRGIEQDSNLCLFLQEDIVPLRHSSGLMRLPVFWEDDIHFCWPGTDWNLDAYYPHFLKPGLKVINVHPIHFAMNTPNLDFYRSIGISPAELGPEDMERLRHQGEGTRTFVSQLLTRLRTEGFEFRTLAETAAMFPHLLSIDGDPDRGRADRITSADHESYWQKGDAEKQEAIRKLYDLRNAADKYATSRDYNQRELEISAIGRALEGKAPGKLADLGCGNGYTLISVARKLQGWDLTGVDFSTTLIGGANHLLEEAKDELGSTLRFQHGDALAFLAGTAEGALDAVLTERFILNLPTVDVQKSTIADIYRVLAPGGLFLMCEGSMEGLRGLNALRSGLGIEEILPSSADNISSLRFEDKEIEAHAESLGFELLAKEGFSFFFAVSRALHPAMIKPRKPQFAARINDLAREIQEMLPFEPGVGSNVLWVLRKKG